MSDRLAPIPTPPAQRWRQARLQYVPAVVFVLGLAAAMWLWSHWVAPPVIVGEAETVRAELRAVQPGLLASLTVGALQPVKAGDVIGRVLAADPRVLAASLAVIRAEIELMRTTLDPVVGRTRVALDVERLRLDLMSERVALAELRGQLVQAEATLARTAALHAGRMVTDEQFEAAKNAREALVAQVAGQSELVEKLEPGIRALDTGGAAATPAAGLAAAMKQKEEELRLAEAQFGPVPLVAPIDGIVTLVLRRAGENVAAGEPILHISAARSERIVGYFRQPVSIDAKPGMAVEVRTRTHPRRTAVATVTHVAQQYEFIPASLLAAMRLPAATVPTELGLRVHIAPPAGLALRPGEHVDLIVRE